MPPCIYPVLHSTSALQRWVTQNKYPTSLMRYPSLFAYQINLSHFRLSNVMFILPKGPKNILLYLVMIAHNLSLFRLRKTIFLFPLLYFFYFSFLFVILMECIDFNMQNSFTLDYRSLPS